MSEAEVEIIDLSHDGRGVARHQGKTVFVPGTLPGERARVGIRRRKRQYDEGELLELLSASPRRVEPRCAHFDMCGGCSLQHLETAGQIEAKQKVLADNLQRIGKVAPETWLEPLVADPWGYRRRGRLSVRHVAKKGRVLVGFREAANPRFVADIRRCEVIDPRLGPLLGPLGEILSGLDAAAHIAQIEFAAGDDVLALVLRNMKPLSDADSRVLVDFAKAHDFAVYLQPGGIDTVAPLWPEAPVLEFSLPDEQIRFQFQPLDFVQVNAHINQRMVAQVLNLLKPHADMCVLDLFCGLGNFTLPIARHVAEICGVEGDAGLLARAQDNAQRNGLENVSFHVADLFKDQRGSAWARRDWDAIVLDPPRAGAEQWLQHPPATSVRRIVYVSCNPGTLARDAGMLVSQHGFTLRAAGVMDMFPHTAHVESVAVFDRD
ncbi:MAG: 23S rRNA (uracil(1939)-C(5))-methyltransferase RlmD [Rhodanobacteraceae bacterium]